jgi:8-oxo-dGTP pyrophosphatase MutT (NUDIX family)
MSMSPAAKVVPPPLIREVVAAVLTCRGRVCMVRRSQHVHTDVGFWHCVTGYLPRRSSPVAHMLMEIEEEVGIAARDLTLRGRKSMELPGGWRVHAFHFESRSDEVILNWEHDSVVWLAPEQLGTLRTVQWLGSILSAVEETLPCWRRGDLSPSRRVRSMHESTS